MNLFTKLAEINSTQVKIPQTSLDSSTIPHALQVFFSIAAAVALFMVAFGAFRYTISRGDSNSIKNAKETIIYAAVGLVVTMTGYGIVTFVMRNL